MSMEAGRGEALLRTLPVIQQALEARMRAASQGAENRTRASIAGAQIGQQAVEAEGRQALGAAEVGARMEMQQAALQNEAMMQERQIQARMQIMELEPTQAAKMQVERLRASIAETKRAVGAKEITEAEGAEVIAQAYGLKTPLERQLAESQLATAKMRQQEATQQAELIANLNGAQKASELGFWHRTVNQLAGVADPKPGGIAAIPVTDPKTGDSLGHWALSPTGKDVFVPSGANKAEQMQERQLVIHEQRWGSAFDRALKYADERVEREKLADRTDPKMPGTSAWENPTKAQEARDIYARDYLGKRGFAATWADEETSFMQRRGKGLAQPTGSDAPVLGMDRQPVERKPFDVSSPVTAEQKAFMGRLRDFDSQLKESGLLNRNAKEYQRIAQFIFEAAKVYGQAGAGGALSEDEKKYIDANINQIEFELSKLKQQNAPPPKKSLFRRLIDPSPLEMSEPYPLG